jgi:hypothetical protein
VYNTTSTGGGGAAFVWAFVIIYLVVLFLLIVAAWQVFTKAGKPGWACLIPIYNLYVLLKIVGRPGWWLLLYLIPIVNVIIYVIVDVELANSFGKGAGFAIGLILLPYIFIPILGFGSATYLGPNGAPPAAAPATPAAQMPPWTPPAVPPPPPEPSTG